MSNQIILTKAWEDEHAIQLKIQCFSRFVSANNNIYTSPSLINNLANCIVDFCKNGEDNVLWQNGVKGPNYSPYLSFRFIKKDSLGHVLIEVYIEIEDDNISYNHHCLFNIESEIGVLLDFEAQLRKLTEIPLGEQIRLYNTD